MESEVGGPSTAEQAARRVLARILLPPVDQAEGQSLPYRRVLFRSSGSIEQDA
jgi:hypothetical protein